MSHKVGAIAWMCRHPTASNIVMLLLILGGLLFSVLIRKEVYPDYQFNEIRVTVRYAGSIPTEIESGIVLPIENAIRNIEGVKEVRSGASSGGANVRAELINNVDVESVLRQIENAVNRLRLPDGAEKPRIVRSETRKETMELIVYGDVDPVTIREVSNQVRQLLLNDKQLTQVELHGVSKYEVKIRLNSFDLQRHQLDVASVAKAISSQSLIRSGGKLETQRGDILLQMNEQRHWAREFGDIVVAKSETGEFLRLSEIATIEDGFADKRNQYYYNGSRSTAILIYRVGEQTPVGISDVVKANWGEVESLLPEGVKIDIVRDEADVYKQRMGLLLKNAFYGLMIVLVVLTLFLESKLAFWVTLGIPTSFLGTMLFLPLFDVSLNMISMFAFIIALGIVVDDAIIAGENIYQNLSKGMSSMEAAIEGTKDIAMPLTFSILTNIVAFIPIWFLPGTLGQMFQVVPVVVIVAFAISWIEALFILPTHIAHISSKKESKMSFGISWLRGKIQNGLSFVVDTCYRAFISRVLSFRYLVAATAIAMLIAAVSYSISGHIGFRTMPRVESDYSTANVTLPLGTSLEKALAIKYQLESAAEQTAEELGGKALVKGISTRMISRDGEFNIRIRIFLRPADERTVSTQEVSKLWRSSAGMVSGVEGVRFSSVGGGPQADVAGISIELNHPNNDVLEKASAEMVRFLAEYPSIVDLENTFESGSQQLMITLLPRAKILGLNEQTLLSQVRAAYNGIVAIRQQRGSEEVDVKVMITESEKRHLHALEHYPIKVGNDYIPLDQLVTLSLDTGPARIIRRDGGRRILLNINITPSSEANAIGNSIKADLFPYFEATYPSLKVSFRGDKAQQKESLDSLFINGALVMLVFYCLLSISFKSYSQPILVMFIIPFGFIGALLGHIYLGLSLSIVSLLGVMALGGVVINDSLILVVEMNRQRDEISKSLREAIILGACRRFRPIFLTTLTTFAGLAPMILETSNQAKIMIPMAVSLGIGIVFATLITLVLLPCLYLILEDLLELKERLLVWREHSDLDQTKVH